MNSSVSLTLPPEIPLPPEIQTITLFSGGVSSGCVTPELGRSLLEYMASPSTASVKQQFGMEAA